MQVDTCNQSVSSPHRSSRKWLSIISLVVVPCLGLCLKFMASRIETTTPVVINQPVFMFPPAPAQVAIPASPPASAPPVAVPPSAPVQPPQTVTIDPRKSRVLPRWSR